MTFKIEFLASDGTKTKHKFYDKEETFNRYWEHHRKYIDYGVSRGWTFRGSIVGYDNGKEVRRYPK